MEPVFITNGQLALTALFVLAAGVLSLRHKLGLERDLLVGAVRTVAQLFIMGFALKLIFGHAYLPLVVGVFAVMIWFGARIIRGRVKERGVDWFAPTMAAMYANYFLVTIVVTAVIVQPDPWWKPQYFLPMGGMVVGNSMNALSISLDRLFSDLRTRRDEVEMRLALGADMAEASHEIVRGALKAGMIPSINSLMGVGLVSIPGMMTGQILAGADPMSAIRYQIVIMFMIVGSTALGTYLVVSLARKRCFGPGLQLVPRPGSGTR
ncbi:MAG: iron export ABC transporter permease subunit FetB [Desulfovibrionaceae bacterium]